MKCALNCKKAILIVDFLPPHNGLLGPTADQCLEVILILHISSLSLPLTLVLLERSDKTDGFSFYVSHHPLSGSFCVKEKDSIKLIDGSFFPFAPWSLQ